MNQAERLNEIEDIKNAWKDLFYDAFSVTCDMPDKVTEDMRVRDVVKQFTNALWKAKGFLQAACRGRYMPVECVGIVNNIYLFSGRFYESPKKVEACKIIAKRFVERIVYAEENMFDDEIGIFTEETEMPVFFYNIKEGDISPVVGMLDEIEENGWSE